jgi:hypothetical protein
MFAVIGLTACSGYNDKRGVGDAPIGVRMEQPAIVMENANGFPNYSLNCLGDDTALIGTTRESAPPMVVQDAERLCASVALTIRTRAPGWKDGNRPVRVTHLDCVPATASEATKAYDYSGLC